MTSIEDFLYNKQLYEESLINEQKSYSFINNSNNFPEFNTKCNNYSFKNTYTDEKNILLIKCITNNKSKIYTFESSFCENREK